MIAHENDHGDLTMHIGEKLFALLADHLQCDNRAMAAYLQKLPLRSVVRVERDAA